MDVVDGLEETHQGLPEKYHLSSRFGTLILLEQVPQATTVGILESNEATPILLKRTEILYYGVAGFDRNEGAALLEPGSSEDMIAVCLIFFENDGTLHGGLAGFWSKQRVRILFDVRHGTTLGHSSLRTA